MTMRIVNKKAALPVIMVIVLSFACNLCASEDKKFEAFYQKEWQARLDRDPMLATQMGQMTQNDKLMDVSEAAYLAWAGKTKSLLAELAKLNSKAMSESNQVSYLILKAQLERRLSEIKFKTYQMPFLSDSGFHTQYNRLNLEVPLKTEQHYRDYIARLKALPAYFEQNIRNMEKGIARGFSMPKVVMAGFTDTIKTVYQTPLQESHFWAPFKQMPRTFSEKVEAELAAEAKQVISDRVMPAYARVEQFFRETYIPNTRETLAAEVLPDGKNYYQAQIKHYTTLNLSADEIHQIGLKEVARIRAEMAVIIRDTGFKGDFKAFLKFLRESPQFYAKTAEELLKEASYIAKKMDGKLPKLFTRLPRQPYTVAPVPAEIAPKYTTGRYSGAPLDSDRPGEYWVNTYALDKRPLYVLEALTLHEAVPGHHLQTSLNKELSGLPEFRRQSYISAFGEGWGLYSERLGLEVGFYQDPYSNFGRLTYEMWRAARLVIDTGIHAKGWSRERAIKLLEENSALSTHNIRTEVDRYISWPGQALSYKLGEIKIRELRAQAEKALGENFDLRRFHDAVLAQGSVPLDVLQLQVDKFIERYQKVKQ